MHTPQNPWVGVIERIIIESLGIRGQNHRLMSFASKFHLHFQLRVAGYLVYRLKFIETNSSLEMLLIDISELVTSSKKMQIEFNCSRCCNAVHKEDIYFR